MLKINIEEVFQSWKKPIVIYMWYAAFCNLLPSIPVFFYTMFLLNKNTGSLQKTLKEKLMKMNVSENVVSVLEDINQTRDNLLQLDVYYEELNIEQLHETPSYDVCMNISRV